MGQHYVEYLERGSLNTTMPKLGALLSLVISASLAKAPVSRWPMVGWDAYRKYDFYTLRPDARVLIV